MTAPTHGPEAQLEEELRGILDRYQATKPPAPAPVPAPNTPRAGEIRRRPYMERLRAR